MQREYDVIELRDEKGRRASATYRDGQSVVVARLEDGREVNLSADLLEEREEGYYIPLDLERYASETPQPVRVIPVIEEQVRVGVRTADAETLRVVKQVHEEEQTVTVPLRSERLDVTRVPVNRVVEETPAMHEEEGRLIIPVYEERLVVQKQIVLVEEYHIDREIVETEATETVTLRREDVQIESKET